MRYDSYLLLLGHQARKKKETLAQFAGPNLQHKR